MGFPVFFPTPVNGRPILWLRVFGANKSENCEGFRSLLKCPQIGDLTIFPLRVIADVAGSVIVLRCLEF